MAANGSCFRCGRPGHWSRECPEAGMENNGPDVKCYKCGKPGHFARDCRMEVDRCYRCNKLGHIAKDCPEESTDLGACYNCKKVGHVQKDCPEANLKPCYRCGEVGHLARECPMPIQREQPREVAPRVDDRKCYGCGGFGHISRECPTVTKLGQRDCYKSGIGPVRIYRLLSKGRFVDTIEQKKNVMRSVLREGPYKWSRKEAEKIPVEKRIIAWN